MGYRLVTTTRLTQGREGSRMLECGQGDHSFRVKSPGLDLWVTVLMSLSKSLDLSFLSCETHLDTSKIGQLFVKEPHTLHS